MYKSTVTHQETLIYNIKKHPPPLLIQKDDTIDCTSYLVLLRETLR